MGAIGTENSKACMLFILRMLHAQLQRQVHLPEAERPRVPLLVDEAHYVAGGENVVDQIATHRAAGLEAAFGLQYFAQLGSASEHQQKIVKGVFNLLQSRFLFRMGDAEDAEQATRIAMAVYATMIRDDPDSRARLRVTPEQALNFPNYYCLASWIANGTRAPSFMGQTYPLPDVGDEWADHHLAAQDERVGPYPEQLESTLQIVEAQTEEPAGPAGEAVESAPARAAAEPAKRPTDPRREPAPSGGEPAKHEVQVDYEPPSGNARRPRRQPGPPRRRTSRLPTGRATARTASRRRRCANSRSSTGSTRSGQQTNSTAPTACRGSTTRTTRSSPCSTESDSRRRASIGRAALPGRALRSVGDRLIKLYRHGLIARHTTGLRSRSRTDGKPPWLHSLTRRGLQVAQDRQPAPAISRRREWRADRAAARWAPVARPARARLGDRVPPARRRLGDRSLAHPAIRHRPLSRPASRLRAAPASDHAQRDQGP